jgi:hypothetical protein
MGIRMSLVRLSGALLLWGAGLALAPPAAAQGCRHDGGTHGLPSGSVGAAWVHPRDGEQLFHNTFVNGYFRSR